MVKPVIILSCHTVGLGLVRAFGKMGLPVIVAHYSKGDMGQVSKFVKEIISSPHPGKSPEGFLQSLLECGKRYPGSLLVPADDETLHVVSRNKKNLSQRFTVACTDWEVTELFLDKRNTYRLASLAGVPVPRTYVPSSLDEVSRLGREMEFPCLVKPCFSHRYFEIFRNKMRIVRNAEEMLSAYREASEVDIKVMLQEFIPGPDSQGVNYNSYIVNGVPLVEFTASKVRLAPPSIGIPCVVVSRHVPEVVELGRKILGAMKFEGFSCTEFKRDARDGIFKLMEVNGRHNRSLSLAIECGVNFPWIQYRHLMEGEAPEPQAARTDLYWIDEFKDLPRFFGGSRENNASHSSFFTPYLRPHVFSVFDRRDPLPFLKRCGDAVRVGSNHIASSIRNCLEPRS